MASPPYRSPATSPPYPSHVPLPNPKKRHSIGPGPHNPKRRKASTSSVHPLRQTSFPPEESAVDNGARSPSVESDFTGATGGRSILSSTTGLKKGGRPRKKIGEESVVGSIAKGPIDGRSATGQPHEDGAQDEEEEDEGEIDEGILDSRGQTDKAADQKKLAILVDAFNTDQSERYDMYRRVKLKKETVRRITNQTLSQSVPPSVITTINGFTKVFIGVLVERAREVQKQQMEAERGRILSDPLLERQSAANGNPEVNRDLAMPLSESEDNPDRPKYVGPLQPDHLREAFRRYRRDGEGGGAGVGGWSVGLGVSGTAAARLQGRRLFR